MYKFYPIKNNLKLKTPFRYGNQHLCPIRFKNNHVYIQTPVMDISYINELKLFIGFDDDDIDPKIYQFKQFLDHIKSNIVTEFSQKLSTWLPEQNLDTMTYNDIIFNDTIKLTIIPFITTVLNHEGIEVDFRKIKINKNMRMNAIIELQYVYLTSDSYGINIKLHKIRLYDVFNPSQFNSIPLDPDICPYCNGNKNTGNVKIYSIPPPPPPPPPFQSFLPQITKNIEKNKILSKIPKGIDMSNIINEIKNGIALRKVTEINKTSTLDTNKDVRNISSNDLIIMKSSLKHISD